MDMMHIQRQTTGLAMTQRMQASLRILQMTNADLCDYLAAEALGNPCLDVRLPESGSAGLAPPARAGSVQAGADRDAFARIEAAPVSLEAHVLAQIDTGFFGDDRRIALAFAEALEPSGWLGETVAEVAARCRVEEAEAGAVLEHLQRFDPPGLFARDLAECLTLQARDRDLLTWEMQTILGHLDLLAAGRFAELARLCDAEEADIRAALALIRSFQPKPGEGFASDRPPIQPPDLRVTRGPLGWKVELSRSQLPRLRVSAAGVADPAAQVWLARAESAARWLQRAVERRQSTLLRTAGCLVAHQTAFLEQGARQLLPLSMEEVAAELSLHPSTISRATAARLIETPRGLIPLRAFFSRSVVAEGPAAPQSQDALIALVGEIVAAEDRRKPLSDDAIVKRAREAGAVLARRTVTKYREALGIPSSYERRQPERV